MSDLGHISLRDRSFNVKRAAVTRCGKTWHIEIESHPKVYDNELWAPCLYHQALLLDAETGDDLQRKVVSWKFQTGPEYLHPEIGSMYVFGHHDIRHCKLAFGRHDGNRVEVQWEGICDVFWDDEFSENVPFICRAFAATK